MIDVAVRCQGKGVKRIAYNDWKRRLSAECPRISEAATRMVQRTQALAAMEERLRLGRHSLLLGDIRFSSILIVNIVTCSGLLLFYFIFSLDLPCVCISITLWFDLFVHPGLSSNRGWSRAAGRDYAAACSAIAGTDQRYATSIRTPWTFYTAVFQLTALKIWKDISSFLYVEASLSGDECRKSLNFYVTTALRLRFLLIVFYHPMSAFSLCVEINCIENSLNSVLFCSCIDILYFNLYLILNAVMLYIYIWFC